MRSCADTSTRQETLPRHKRMVGFTLGLTAFFCLWCSSPTRALWEAMLVSGGIALAAAIGVHWFVGYTDLWHLAPALTAAASMIVGLTLTFPLGDERQESDLIPPGHA